MICPQCRCVFCVDDVDDNLHPGHDCRKEYCSPTCKKRAKDTRAGVARLATELGPLSPDDVTVQRMFYTSCPLCGALNDWSDTRTEANRNRRAHIEAHTAPPH